MFSIETRVRTMFGIDKNVFGAEYSTEREYNSLMFNTLGTFGNEIASNFAELFEIFNKKFAFVFDVKIVFVSISIISVI